MHFLLPYLFILLILIASSVFICREDIFHGIIYSSLADLYHHAAGLLMSISYSYQNSIPGGGSDWCPFLHYLFLSGSTRYRAYFIGSLIGKHKLIEHFLPKKSVAGFIAGIIFTLLASFIFARVYHEFSTAFWIGYGALSPCSAPGDLFESLIIKRTSSVKDAGHLIPGHVAYWTASTAYWWLYPPSISICLFFIFLAFPSFLLNKKTPLSV